MSLQKEITIILLVVIGLFAGLDNAIQRFIIYPSYQKIDQERARENVARFQASLEREIYHLSQTVLDWSAWDDTYKFIQDGNEAYRKANLVESFFADIDINSVYFIDVDGKVVWGKAFVDGRDEPVEIEELPGENFPPGHFFLQHENLESFISGVMITTQGPMLVSARPIVTSEYGGPLMGTLIMGKFIDKKLLDILSEQSGIQLEAWTYRCDAPEDSLFTFHKDKCQAVGNSELSKVDKQSFLEAYAGKAVVGHEKDSGHLHSYAVIPGVYNNHFLLIRADSPMDVTKIGQDVFNGALLSLLTGGLLLLIVLREAIKLSVLSPITKLTEHAVALRNSETLDSNISDTLRSDNEIGTLAREFDLMVFRLGKARRQLAEQSYFSGMTEMASGVMHNIRNALTPIIGHVDLMKEELRDLPLKEMEAAANEISSGDIPAERLERLKEFQEGSFTYLAELVSDFTVRLDGMASRVEAIENIINKQEVHIAFGRQEEDIKLEVLINEALEMMKIEYFRSLDIDIDTSLEGIGNVRGPRNALMNIFTNLINNAVDAIIQSGRERGLIRISGKIEGIEGASFVHLMVNDNGCGILKENLERIFERGYSSKGVEGSGVGLHWCANTMTSIRGRLYAESGGVNHGATVHLLIPQNAVSPGIGK